MSKTRLFEMDNPDGGNIFTPVVDNIAAEIQETSEEVVETPEVVEEEESTPEQVEETIETEVIQEGGEESERVQENVITENPNTEIAKYANNLLKDEGFDLFGEEVPEDLSMTDIRGRLKDVMREEVSSEIQAEVMQELSNQGINEQALLYAKLIQSGADLNTLSDASRYDAYSNTPEDSEDEVKTAIIRASLEAQKMSKKHIDRLLDVLDVEDSIDEEFQTAKTYFSKAKKELIQAEEQRASQQAEQQKQAVLQRKQKVDELINSKKIGEFKINGSQAQELKKSIYTASEIVESGGTKYKVTPFQKFLHQMQGDLDLQLELFARSKFGEAIIESTKKEVKKDYEESFINALVKAQNKEAGGTTEEEVKPTVTSKRRLFEYNT